MSDTIFDFGSSGVALPAASGGVSYVPTIIVVAVVLIALVALLIVLRRMLFQPDLHGLTREAIQTRWEEIEKVAETGLMGSKMAVVEADKLLDGALKSMGMVGDTMGERLKFAGYRYPELRKVWYAHRLRNQLVHETSFELSPSQARSAVHEYKKALKAIHVL